MVNETLRTYSTVHILVNNATTFIGGRVEQVSVEDWTTQMGTAVIGSALCVKHSLPAMKQAGGGAIVNLGSISSVVAEPNGVPYCTSKAALLNMTRCLAMDLASFNIRVNIVCPGIIDTPVHAADGLTPEDVEDRYGHHSRQYGSRRGKMKILTHNVYWFQGHPSRWGHERVAEVPEVLEALTRLYASADVDVLCLQEVHRNDLADTLAHELGMRAWLHAPGGLRPDYGGVVMSRGGAQFRDCTRADGYALHERIHLRASVEEGSGRLELAAVHLPSNRFANSSDAGDAARIAELRRVLAEPSRPSLIVGDMNCPPDSPPYRFMREAGYLDASVVAGDDTALRHRVDYMWLDETWTDRMTGFAVLNSGAFCRTPPEGDAWRLSDHPPLLMEVR